MMKAFLLLSLHYFSQAIVIPRGVEHLTGDDLVDYLNSHQKLFKAGSHDYSLDQMKQKVMDRKYLQPKKGELHFAPKIDSIRDEDIPDFFDSRERWYNCPSIGNIRDQAQCASCWAFGVAEVITDRICIASNGTKQPVISPEDILTCCSSFNKDCGSCEGGYPDYALNFYHQQGVVTGGGFESKVGCKSYAFSPCGTHDGMYYGRCPAEVSTPQCSSSCDENYKIDYKKDKFFGQAGYRVKAFDVAAIQKEILLNGPVVDCFDCYSDIYNYKSGIYVHTGGSYLGGHCVKLIGWGTENGTPYWIAANSWHDDFGENGFFRVLRGVNEVSFEEFIYASIPQQ